LEENYENPTPFDFGYYDGFTVAFGMWASSYHGASQASGTYR
jgi:hypothetical protein